MRAVMLVAKARLARGGLALVAVSVLLGIGFGLSFASIVAARRTASAYDRILAASDAPDAAIQHGLPPDVSELSLRTIDGIVDQRVYVGFVGNATGVDPALTRALLAPTDNHFPLELPVVHEGRLPNADAPDEVFVDAEVADAENLRVGQHVEFGLFAPDGSDGTDVTVEVVGIGSYPVEAVSDETAVLSVWVFTRAFYDAHRELVVYSVSNVDLAAGVDARRDLAPAVSALGHELQSARNQERRLVNTALRPTVIVLVGFALLAFVATVVAMAQLIQRERDRWSSETATLLASGMTRGHVRRVQMVAAAVVATVAVVISMTALVLASPVAPIGALHDIDPAQGLLFDRTIAFVGIVAILLAVAGCTLAFARPARPARRVQAVRAAPFTAATSRPAALAGLTLAFRAERGRGRVWRSLTAATIATALFALGAALVASARTLTSTPASYGFDADLLAVNQYGDQSLRDLETAFADASDVAAATGYTSGDFLLNGRAVPGLAASRLKGDLMPTLLRGELARTDQEIVVGQDTLSSLDADIGDILRVQISLTGAGATTGEAVDMRIVGVATFPPVNMVGRDMARLGVGAVITRDAYTRLRGEAANVPEFTAVRVADGVDPQTVVDRLPGGFTDALQTETMWFTDAKPAELRQLDLAIPYLRGALAISYLILIVVIAHAHWTRVRTNRRDLAVLAAMGCTPRQVDEVTAWHMAPFALAALFVGLPAGLLLGHVAFTRFARSIAVVDDAVTPLPVLVLLIAATLVALAVAVIGSVVLRRRESAPLRLSA